ncbi:MAG TPA: DUF3857 domain-containing protein [Candidatus Sulfotelmatobacter sp.]|nr:DUF3857 domain-containing protein [Candidatus Sulfotelmatobacter sp.]
MFNRRSLLFLALIAVSVLNFPGKKIEAGDEWLPITPEELKMTSEPKAPGAPAIYLYRQVDRKDQGRANTEYNYVRIKILTEEGRKYANIEIPYVNQKVGISNIRARSVRQDGTIANFDGKVYEKVIEKRKGEKIKAKVFTVADVQVGSIVEYHFTYDFEDGYVFNSYWGVSDELFTKSAKFSLMPYERFAVRWEWPAGLPEGTEPPKQGPDRIVRMSSQNVPAFETEDLMPPENELRFRVVFIYSEDTFESDPVKYWRKFGKKQNDRLESFLGKKKDLEAAAAQIVSPNDAPEVKLQKIYARVQQVRNLSYEPRKSEEEAKRDKQKKIENVADILKLGYGDGVDLTWLFLGLARAAGFEGYGAWVAPRSEYLFNEKRMNSGELAANVVLIKVGGKDRYFDPGSAFVPYGMLPWSETATRGLKLDKEGGSWIQTPFPDSAESQIQRKAELKLDQQGTLEGTVKLTFTGLEAWSCRLQERNQDEEARKKYLEDELKGYVPASTEVELKNQPDWKSSDTPLVAEFHVRIPGWVSGAGKRALMPVGIFSAPEKHVFAHSNRVYPVYFNYPFQRNDEVTVELPAGWVVSSAPAALDQDAKAAEYKLTVDDRKKSVRITRTVRCDLLVVPKESYSVLRTFYEAVRTGDDQQVVLQPGAVAAGN